MKKEIVTKFQMKWDMSQSRTLINCVCCTYITEPVTKETNVQFEVTLSRNIQNILQECQERGELIKLLQNKSPAFTMLQMFDLLLTIDTREGFESSQLGGANYNIYSCSSNDQIYFESRNNFLSNTVPNRLCLFLPTQW